MATNKYCANVNEILEHFMNYAIRLHCCMNVPLSDHFIEYVNVLMDFPHYSDLDKYVRLIVTNEPFQLSLI